MQEAYDVVVAGAGPAGLGFAREVASRSDYSVAVLERNDDLRENDKSTGGTFLEVVEGYGLPDHVVMAGTDSVAFEGPAATGRLDIEGYVLDFPALLEFLGRDAAAAGADVHTGVTVTGPLLENGGVRGVRYRSLDGESGYDRERDLRASVTVDATGPTATLTSDLGFFDRGTAQRGIGLEFEAEGRYETEGTMLFRFDHSVAPGGYAWTFPAGDGVFKAGVCWVDDFRAVHGSDATIHEHVERWVESDPRWQADRVRAKHAGEVVSNNSLDRRADDGFLAVGDAVSSINPLFGEGIRPGMQSAEMAADVALDALDAGDVSRERLAAYERRWREEKGRAWTLQRVVGELLYDFDADQQDRFVRKVDGLSPAATERLRTYELSFRDLVGLYPFAPKDLVKVPRLMRHL
jgi:digeranylgeranylglycerophospholipid reductase